MKKFLLSAAALLALSGCGAGDWLGGEPEKAPLPGDRISVLDFEKDLRPESEGAAAFEAPQARNASWPQAGGNPAHMPEHVALQSGQLKKIWSADIGEGTRKNIPLTAQPVLAGESIFTLDTDARLSAFDSATGKRRWSVNVRDEAEKDPVISGGIAFDNGIIFVAAGYDEAVAVNAVDGAIKWRAKLPAPFRAAPAIADGRVFVTTLSNTLVALDAASGAVQWEFSGLGQSTGLIGAASPAFSGDLVIPAFSSGEVYALRAGNGSVAWSDTLASNLRLGGLNTLSDIRGLPVVADNAVYAISFAGKMAAIDLLTGARVWQRDISGSKTPWVAGNRIFLISTEAQIVALDRANGAVIWVSQLARYKDRENKSDPIVWTGPILAGGRLLAFSTDGRVAEINPAQGTLIREWHSGESVSIMPIVAGETLYILGDDGDLTAYK
jgi:outer membrane protein assembly factor BamB